MKTAEELLEEAALNLGYGDIDEMLIVEPHSVVRSIVLSRMQTYADQFKNEWVSVKDRLPGNRQYVLAYTTNGGYTSSAEYKHDCFFNGLDQLGFVTHWQPLPSPPKTTEK